MGTGAIVGVIVFIVVLIAVIAAIYIYNTLVRLRNSCDEAFSTMDVYLKRRFDLIPNLVEAVKGYAAHESNTLNAVIAARTTALHAQGTINKVETENTFTGTLQAFFAVAESYPDLKANTNFLDLQKQLQMMETDIAQSRKYYNGIVREMNNKVEMFPSNIFAGIFKFVKYPFFTLADKSERKNVAISSIA